MTERVHRVFAPLAAHLTSPLVTACGQRDGELRPEALKHYVTIGGRVTCPDCLRAMGEDVPAGGQLAMDFGGAA